MAVTREYKCKECKEEFEFRESILDDPIKVCPECKGELKQVYATNNSILWFSDPRNGAISNRYETKGVGCKNPWNIKRQMRKFKRCPNCGKLISWRRFEEHWKECNSKGK